MSVEHSDKTNHMEPTIQADVQPQEPARSQHESVTRQPTGNAASSDNKNRSVSVLIAEFNALRAEILFRATTQATLLAVNITAIGVVAGYVFAKQADAITLLIIPILSPTLGMLWIDHDINIRSIGRFIGGEWSRAMDVYVDSSLPTYQRTAEKEITNIRWRVLGFGLPMSIAFGVLPLCAFAYAVVASPLSGSLVFWGPALVGIAVIGTFFLMMISVLELSSLAWLRQTDGPQR
jgi:hypothetical protein